MFKGMKNKSNCSLTHDLYANRLESINRFLDRTRRNCASLAADHVMVNTAEPTPSFLVTSPFGRGSADNNEIRPVTRFPKKSHGIFEQHLMHPEMLALAALAISVPIIIHCLIDVASKRSTGSHGIPVGRGTEK